MKCPKCKIAFQDRHEYAGHMSTHRPMEGVECPKCGRTGFSSHQQYAGHMRLHQVADRMGVSLRAAREYLVSKAIAATDAAPWNGAWSRWHALAQQQESGGNHR